jgi:aminopeptidase N
VPYEKGFNFLYFLQSLLKDYDRLFETILQNYFKKFKYTSVDYLDFKNHFINQLQTFLAERADPILEKIDWDTWILKSGKPPVENDFSK